MGRMIFTTNWVSNTEFDDEDSMKFQWSFDEKTIIRDWAIGCHWRGLRLSGTLWPRVFLNSHNGTSMPEKTSYLSHLSHRYNHRREQETTFWARKFFSRQETKRGKPEIKSKLKRANSMKLIQKRQSRSQNAIQTVYGALSYVARQWMTEINRDAFLESAVRPHGARSTLAARLANIHLLR